MENIEEDFEEVIFERLDEILLKIEKKEKYKKVKKQYNNMYEDFYNLMEETNIEGLREFENIISANDELHLQSSKIYYLAGIIDGIKLTQYLK